MRKMVNTGLKKGRPIQPGHKLTSQDSVTVHLAFVSMNGSTLPSSTGNHPSEIVNFPLGHGEYNSFVFRLTADLLKKGVQSEKQMIC